MDTPRVDHPPVDAESARLRAAVAASLADVDAAGVASGPDRAVVLRMVLSARLGVLATGTPPPPEQRTEDAAGTAPTSSPSGAKGDLLDEISAAMKLPREVVELVYDVRDGELTLIVAPRMLATDKANATRQLAQLVAGGRQAAGVEEWTAIDSVRSVVTDYGRLDSGNFASYIGKLDKVFRFTGKGAKREMKVTRPGMEEIAQLVRSVSGVGG